MCRPFRITTHGGGDAADWTAVPSPFDAEMVSAAKDRLAPFGDRAICQQVDATALPFADASFDTVLSFIMLHHVGDWGAARGEAVRVLRPGGRLIGYDLLRTRLFARLHPAEAQGIGMMRLDLLQRRLDALPVSARLRPGLFGTVVRFIARKH